MIDVLKPDLRAAECAGRSLHILQGSGTLSNTRTFCERKGNGNPTRHNRRGLEGRDADAEKRRHELS